MRGRRIKALNSQEETESKGSRCGRERFTRLVGWRRAIPPVLRIKPQTGVYSRAALDLKTGNAALPGAGRSWEETTHRRRQQPMRTQMENGDPVGGVS